MATAAVDSLGLCLFVAFAVLDDARGVPCMAKLVSGLTGKEYSVDDLVGMGVNCSRTSWISTSAPASPQPTISCPVSSRKSCCPRTMWVGTSPPRKCRPQRSRLRISQNQRRLRPPLCPALELAQGPGIGSEHVFLGQQSQHHGRIVWIDHAAGAGPPPQT